MDWQVFTYKESKHSEKLTYAQWLTRLTNGIRAEQVIVLPENQVLIYFPNNYNDEFDDFGEPL